MQEKKKTNKNKLKAINKTVVGIYILIITLSLNELNAPIKRNGLAKWIFFKRPVYMLSTRDPLQT